MPLYARVENSEERVHSIKNSLLFELKERKGIDRILNIEIERSAAGKTKKKKESEEILKSSSSKRAGPRGFDLNFEPG